MYHKLLIYVLYMRKFIIFTDFKNWTFTRLLSKGNNYIKIDKSGILVD
jgi:hypothetical protein